MKPNLNRTDSTRFNQSYVFIFNHYFIEDYFLNDYNFTDKMNYSYIVGHTRSPVLPMAVNALN